MTERITGNTTTLRKAGILVNDFGISFKKTSGAREDVYTVYKGKDIIGYTRSGEDAKYDALLDGKGNIVGWEHSFCHEPQSMQLKDGKMESMAPETRKSLAYGKSYRALWSKVEKNDLTGVVPGGKFLGFIEANIKVK